VDNGKWREGEIVEHSSEIIDRAINEIRPEKVFALFSGGNDSLATTHIAAQHLGTTLDGVVHINTGIGIPQTREFVRDTCKQYGWPLVEYKAVENTKADGTPDPIIYEELVTKWGFPGPYGHRLMYIRLKERALARLRREHGKNILLISGFRRQESSRRMKQTEATEKKFGFNWCCPCFYMDKREILQYRREKNLPHNEVCDLLHMSGECLCGAFAHKGELAEIEMWFPDVGRHIRDLEKKVRDAGFPWGWEEGPPEWWVKKKNADKAGQEDAFDRERDEVLEGAGFQPLCAACNKRAS